MSEPQSNHPSEDELLELSLGSLSSDAETTVLQHVNSCLPCRASYDEISRTLDATLPASPAVAPPVGFESRALARIGIRETLRTRASRRLPLLIAAAAVVGVAVGAGAAAAILDRDSSPPSIEASDAGALLKDDGSNVGNVLQSHYDGKDVLIMSIDNGPPGVHYTCRLRLADGSARSTGEWTVPDAGKAVWIVADPSGVDSVELVTDSGKVWASASVGS
jgi:hypothetical protein